MTSNSSRSTLIALIRQTSPALALGGRPARVLVSWWNTSPATCWRVALVLIHSCADEYLEGVEFRLPAFLDILLVHPLLTCLIAALLIGKVVRKN